MSTPSTPAKASPQSYWNGVADAVVESVPVELSSKEREEYEAKWRDIIIKLAAKKTDGKEKTKAFENLVLVCRSLKEDLKLILTEDNADEMLRIDHIVKLIRQMLVHRSSYIRAAAVRSMRHLFRVLDVSRCFWKYHCYYFLSPMFFVDKRQDKEKRQIIELMRQITKKFSDAEAVPVLLVKGLVSVAENPEDPYSATSTEILRDLLVKNPYAVSTAGGTKILLSAVIDPKFKDIAESIVMTFLYLLDDAETRKYVRDGEIQTIFAPFTQEYTEDKKEQRNQWEASRKAICIMMKSWTGLVVLSKSGLGLRALVNALKINHEERQQIILDIIIDILRNASPQQFHSIIPALSTEERGKNNQFLHLNVYANSTLIQLQQQQQPATNQPQEDNILLVYLAVTIISLLRNGVIRVLMELSRLRGIISDRAGQIVQVVLVFCDMLLHSDRCLEMHDKFDDDIAKEIKSDTYIRTLSLLTTYSQQSSRVLQSSSQSSSSKILNNLTHVKTQVDAQMDDIAFNQLVKDSNVLVTKDDKRWIWDKIKTLVYGPLRIGSRLQEVLKTEFPKRLIAYYKPQKKLFSDLNYQESHQHLAMLASQFIENLLSLEEGRQFLRKCGFMEQLYEVLKIECENGGANTILSEERVAYKMSREYFTILGKFTQHLQGVQILQECKIFSLLQALTTRRDDICQLIIKNLEYRHSYNTASRLILKEAMLSGSRKIRYISTLRLRKLVRECTDFHTWGIELLKLKLTDEWDDVSKHALRILAEACTVPINLDALISFNPDVKALEKHSDGRHLLLRMAGREQGLEYLTLIGWLQTSLNEWREMKNLDYVARVEHALHKAMTSTIVKRSGLGFSIVSDEGVNLPPHFYGEICKTETGCNVLLKSGDFQFLMDELNNTDVKRREIVSYNDEDRIELSGMTDHQWSQLYRRSILWALAQIGSSDTGYTFLSNHYPIQNFIDFAQKSSTISMRGAALYLLSILSKSPLAREELERRGWECHCDNSTYIAVPSEMDQFFAIGNYVFEGSSANVQDPYTAEINVTINAEILKHLESLANPVTEMASTKALAKMKSQNIDDFDASVLFFVHNILTKYRYSLRARKFLFLELFSHVVISETDFERLDRDYLKL
jgi:rapamycin-insensitive companion of mTOR